MCGSDRRAVGITEVTKHCWIRRPKLKVKIMLVDQRLWPKRLQRPERPKVGQGRRSPRACRWLLKAMWRIDRAASRRHAVKVAWLRVIGKSVGQAILHGHVVERRRFRGQAGECPMASSSRERTELAEMVPMTRQVTQRIEGSV
jgi:hypothetical protein